jgi:hypothetical protein
LLSQRNKSKVKEKKRVGRACYIVLQAENAGGYWEGKKNQRSTRGLGGDRYRSPLITFRRVGGRIAEELSKSLPGNRVKGDSKRGCVERGVGRAGTTYLGLQRTLVCLNPLLLPQPRCEAVHRVHTDTGSPFPDQAPK